jgi:subtilisin
MYHPDPKICTEKSALDFLVVLKALKRTDEELYQLVSHQFTKQRWQAFARELREKRPGLEAELTALIKAGAKREKVIGAGVVVRDRLRVIAQEVAATYKCETGFQEARPTKRTVYVKLKMVKPVIGLPREIINLSDRLARDHGSKRIWTFGFDNRTFIADLDDDAIERLRQHDQVEAVEIPGMARILSNPNYNPLAVNTDWGVDRVHPYNAWTKGLFGRGIKVCVCDTGIQKNNLAFWKDGKTPFKGGYNFIANTNDPEDDQDHGTYCCSIIAHQHTGIVGTYRGLAPDIDLYVCKVLDSKGTGTMAQVAAGIDWARTHGMDIISMSLGGPGDATLQAVCDAAWYAGILILAAAGNEGPGINTVGYPAKYQSCVAVAAVDANENVASYSSRGPEVEVAAPGSAITGAWAGITYVDYVVPGSGNRYMCASGTSAACPHVSAISALMKQWYPLATNLDLRLWLREHARDI